MSLVVRKPVFVFFLPGPTQTGQYIHRTLQLQLDGFNRINDEESTMLSDDQREMRMRLSRC